MSDLESILDTVSYEEKYVVFVDLLGFKSFVEAADSSSVKLLRLYEVLETVRDTLYVSENLKVRFTHFSDCIVFSVPRIERGLISALQAIEVLADNLLQYDVFVRGGLAVGRCHHSPDFVFGPALNNAYLLESVKAKFPRILVSSDVVSDIDKLSGGSEKYILRYRGDWMVHYLRQYENYDPDVIFAGKAVLDLSGQRIVDFVNYRLNHDREGVLEKSEWFRDYWNDTVASAGVFKKIDGQDVEYPGPDGMTNQVIRLFQK